MVENCGAPVGAADQLGDIGGKSGVATTGPASTVTHGCSPARQLKLSEPAFEAASRETTASSPKLGCGDAEDAMTRGGGPEAKTDRGCHSIHAH